MYFVIGIYTIYINKLGHNEKTNSEGVIASGVLTILSEVPVSYTHLTLPTKA